MVEHVCQQCGKEFSQKSDLAKHYRRKTPCVSREEIEDRLLGVLEGVKGKTSKDISDFVFRCLDLLRSDGITGFEALKNINGLLILKMAEPRIESGVLTFNLDDFQVDEEEGPWIEKDDFKLWKKEGRLDRLRFSRLASMKADDDATPEYIREVAKTLKQHRVFRNIFTDDTFTFQSGRPSARLILYRISEIDLSDVSTDILGDAYELILKRFGESKDYAQFFTPRWVQSILVQKIDPQPDEFVFDPACGSGGFLTATLQHWLKNNSNLDLLEAGKNLGGQEIARDTLMNCYGNLIASTGAIPQSLLRGDTLREYLNIRPDVILSNPPFGLKGVKWTETPSCETDSDDEERWYCPIKTNESTNLFLQIMISRLKVGGRCAVIIPNGQELSGTGKPAHTHLRQLLLTACRLDEVMFLPKGTFANAGVQTCALFFTKVHEIEDVLEIKNLKSQTVRTRKFLQEPADVEIVFSQIKDPKGSTPEILGRRKVSELGSEYVLRWIEQKTKTVEYEGEMAILGDICEIKNGKALRKNQLNPGPYPVIGGGVKPMGTHDEFNVDINTILISKDGAGSGYVSRYSCPIFATSHCLYLHDINEEFNSDFLFCYLKFVLQEEMYALQTGAAQPGVKREDLNQLQIPLIDLEKQRQIADRALNLGRRLQDCRQRLEDYESDKKDFIESLLERVNFKEIPLKELSEIKAGKAITKKQLCEGPYPVIGGGMKPMGYHSESNLDAKTLLISKDGAGAGFVSRYDSEIFATGHCLYLENLSEDTSLDYLFCILKYFLQDGLYKLQCGAAQPGIKRKDLEEVLVPIPSLRQQKKIVSEISEISELQKSVCKEYQETKELLRKHFLRHSMECTLEPVKISNIFSLDSPLFLEQDVVDEE